MVEIAVACEASGRQFEGLLIHDDSVRGRRPAIFMQPDGTGIGDGTIAQAREAAGRDYVVLLADLFGRGYGARPRTQDELIKTARAVREDVSFIHACGGKALETLSAEAERRGLIDPGRTFAIGYCIGGGILLEQARADADFKATAVFHVTLPNPAVPGTRCGITGRVLAIHGAADPVTPKPLMDALEQELTDAKVDWQLVLYGYAPHSFCDPAANSPAARYDAKLCRKSYALMREFFQEAP
jgi:dienelactone hydrolase